MTTSTKVRTKTSSTKVAPAIATEEQLQEILDFLQGEDECYEIVELHPRPRILKGDEVMECFSCKEAFTNDEVHSHKGSCPNCGSYNLDVVRV